MEEYIKEYPESGFMRDLPYGLELLGENLLDISHLPFSHHSVGGFCREDARPLQLRALSKKERLQSIKQEAEAVDIHEDLQLSNRNYSAPVFQVEVQNASLSDPTFMARNRTRQVEANSTATSGFYDPCHIRYRRVFGGRSGANIELFLCPTASGKSRVFFFNTFERALKRNMDEAVNAQKDWFGRMKQRFINSRIRILVGGSEWHGHMVAHDIFDGDGIFLNKQGDRMNRDGLTYKDYFIPTTADVLVKNYRRWLDSAAEITLTRYGKEGMAAVASATGTVADPSGQPAYLDRDQREQMLDRYSSHTKNCKICSQALSKLQKNRSTMDVIRTAMLGAVGASSSTLSICFFWPCQEEVLHRLPE
jgi:phenylpropionate dioxygenase-like ring-hydroxylating dioxygenase large terminal subunit